MRTLRETWRVVLYGMEGGRGSDWRLHWMGRSWVLYSRSPVHGESHFLIKRLI